MLKTTQLAAGVMGGLWGLGASLLWWVFIITSGQIEEDPQALPISGLMGVFSLSGLIGSVRSAGEPAARGVVLLWAGALLLLLATAVTFLSLGLIYAPAVLLLVIAAILATVRSPWRPKRATRWLELGVGGLGGALGIITSGLLLTVASSPVPQGDLALQQAGSVLPLQAEAARVIFRFVMGGFSIAFLVSLGLHAWRGSRNALAVIWGTAGGLFLGSVVGFFVGGLIYLPVALLVVAGSLVATFRDVPER